MMNAAVIALIILGAFTKNGWQAHIFAIALMVYSMASKAGAIG